LSGKGIGPAIERRFVSDRRVHIGMPEGGFAPIRAALLSANAMAGRSQHPRAPLSSAGGKTGIKPEGLSVSNEDFVSCRRLSARVPYETPAPGAHNLLKPAASWPQRHPS